jgi:hypothetical protein
VRARRAAVFFFATFALAGLLRGVLVGVVVSAMGFAP